MLSDRIIIKGTSNGLVISMGSGVWPGLLEELDQSLSSKAAFFKGGRVALHVGPRQLTRLQLEAVGQLLSQHNVTLWAVESEATGTQEAATELGLETTIAPQTPVLTPTNVTDIQGDSIVIQRTLRSGQVIDFPGNIVIIGDVNPGAEIRAGGSIIVWGRLRGIVQAGANSERAENSVVCALHLSPMQLRIGDKITRAPAVDEAGVVPEMAFIQDNQIVAEPWYG